MDRKSKALIHKIASAVRYHMEDRAYHETDIEDHQLCGYCAIASAELYHHLTDVGINPVIHVAESHQTECHVFLNWDDYVIDITATQFQDFIHAPVLIEHEKKLQGYWFYSTTVMFDHPKQLAKWQKKTDWPREQLAVATRKIPKL